MLLISIDLHNYFVRIAFSENPTFFWNPPLASPARGQSPAAAVMQNVDLSWLTAHRRPQDMLEAVCKSKGLNFEEYLEKLKSAGQWHVEVY